jgi:DNA-binding LacI/PurR family transcriptional regulator
MAAMRSRHTTIHDIATRANVALSSVLRALNGPPAVSEPLRERVLRAVAELVPGDPVRV